MEEIQDKIEKFPGINESLNSERISLYFTEKKNSIDQKTALSIFSIISFSFDFHCDLFE